MRVTLNSKLSAIVETIRLGQNPPCENDDVAVEVYVKLPINTGIEINSDLRFGKRLIVCGENLHSTWGHPTMPPEYRYKKKKFHSPTYAQAEAEAIKWAKDELVPLTTALAKRKLVEETAG